MESIELADVQGIVAYAYAARREAVYALLRVDGVPLEERRRWLRGRLEHVPSAQRDPEYRSRRHEGAVTAIAFTRAGLEQFDVGADAINTFAPEFRQGMSHPHRSRVLGDVGDNAPIHWRWGKEPGSVHVFVASYGADHRQLADELHASLPAGFECVREVRAKLLPADPGRPDGKEFIEPFGFRDGISDPYVHALGRPALHNAGDWNRVAAGDFVFGYPNQLRRLSEIPALSAAETGDPVAGEMRRTLGRNGSLLAIRELDQDVALFRRENPEPRQAAKLIGRWYDGAPLVLAPEGRAGAFATLNDFRYHALDRDGLRCPLGAHVRRSNPRDSFADPELPKTEAEAIASANEHRLVRRGRPFLGDNGQPQGLFFMCLNTDLPRQFEFAQQSWLGSPSFAGLSGERDLAVGVPTRFSVPSRGKPEHRTLSAYVKVRGGGYFFLPGLRALRYLAGERRPGAPP
jgi:deferrochelatase/peroxidase EfeB